MRIKSAFAILLAAVSFSASAVISPGVQVELIEFYNKSLDHYFVTANPAEANDLDTGVHVGWVRTGYRFPVIKIGSTQPATTPTCRFYGRPEAKIDSHFYSSKSIECEDVKKKFPEAWLFEGDEVFRAFAVDPNTGKCPVDAGPVYRLWNNRSDVNHRYTDQISVYNEMVAKGYIPEGDGNPLQPVAFCQPSGNSVVPPPPAGSPSCTLSAATATPAIGTVQTLTATCTGTPTSYTWTGCASVGLPNTCQATRATVGAANYSVRATNAAGAGAAVTMTLTWGGTPGVVPQCTISASNTTPSTGSSITLSANCSQTPTRYDWLACDYYFADICQIISSCPVTATTCSVSQSIAGFARYGVRGTNGAGSGRNATVEVEWKGGGGGGGGGGGTAPVCTVGASDAFPPLSTNLQLVANCVPTATTFLWSGSGVTCGSQSICQTLWSVAGPQTYFLTGSNSGGSSPQASVTVNWGGSPGPPVPVCTPSSNVGLTPTVGQTAVISSNCTNAPTSFAWVNCTPTTATCSDAPITNGSKTYYLTATNSAGPSVQTSLTLNWLRAPTAPPTCSISGANAASTGQPIPLTANCLESPTSYTWTNCPSTGATCIATSTTAGTQNYTVKGTNSFGPGPDSPMHQIVWTQSTSSDFCGPNTVRINMPWGTPATGGINPIQTAGYGGFTGSNVFVVAVTAVGGPYSVPGDTNLSEFGDPAVFRTMTVSKSSCDFRAPDPTGASGPYVFIDATSQPKANWNVGAPPYYFVAGTTYYFNFKNYTDQFGLGNTCPSGTCNARITVNFPK